MLNLPPSTVPSSGSTAEAIPRPYRRRDELAQYSLPDSHPEPLRKVVWTNMLCACVLAAGLFGVQTPVRVVKNRPGPDHFLVPIEEINSPSPPTRQTVPPAEQLPTDDSETLPGDPPPVALPIAVLATDVMLAIPIEVPLNIVEKTLKAAPLTRNWALANAGGNPLKAAPEPPAKPSRAAKFSRGRFTGEFPDMRFEDFSKDFRTRNRGKALSARIQWNLTPEGVATNFLVLKASAAPEFEREIIRWMKRKYRFDPPGQPFVLFQDIEQSN